MGAYQIWRRRWALTIFLLLLALVGTGVAALRAPRTYQAQSMVVLLASHNSSKAMGGNPYLSFSDSLSTTASVISSELMDPQTASTLRAQGFPEGYQVVSQATLSQTTLLPAPFVQVTVTGSNRALVEHTLVGVTREIGYLLTKLQVGVSAGSKISSFVASFAQQPSLSITSTARPLVVVLGILIILALGIPLVVDAWAARRRSSRDSDGVRTPSLAGRPQESHLRNGLREPGAVASERQRQPSHYYEREGGGNIRRPL
jgi:hypothetical protein